MSYSAYDAKLSLIFLNEYYYLHKKSYQNYLEKLLNSRKLPVYNFFIDNSKSHKEFTSLFDVLGIYQSDICTDFPIKNDYCGENITQTIRKQKCLQIITITPTCYEVKIKFLKSCSLLIPFSDNIVDPDDGSNWHDNFRLDWVMHNLRLLRNSKVFRIKSVHKNEITFRIILSNIKYNKPYTLWTRIYKYYINGWIDNNFNQLLYISCDEDELFTLYLVGLIFMRYWNINDSFDLVINRLIRERNVSATKMKLLLENWLNDIEWMRKRDYLMIIFQLREKKNSIFNRLYQLDEYLRLKIISYL